MRSAISRAVACVDKYVSQADDVSEHLSETAYVIEHISCSMLTCIDMSAIRRDVPIQSAKVADVVYRSVLI